MKYNISNLEKFKSSRDSINCEILEQSQQLVHRIIDNRSNLIEDKIKELISPYINVNASKNQLIQLIEESKYKLGNVVHIDYEEYYIINTIDNSKDYFLTRHNVNLKECKAWTTISEIVRGINK